MRRILIWSLALMFAGGASLALAQSRRSSSSSSRSRGYSSSGRSSTTRPSTLDAAATAPAASRPAATRPAVGVVPVRASERYQIVVDRNMFTRNVGSGGGYSGSRYGSSGDPASRPGRNWVLTGIVLLPDEQVAFLENTRSGTTVRAHVGYVTEVGRLAQIDPDQITIDAGDHPAHIRLGSALDGAPPSSLSGGYGSTPSYSSGSSGSAGSGTASRTTTSATPAAAAAPVDAAAILERLRARAAAERGAGGPPN